ncbi:MAG: 4-(cytidine 5'-diphospho)-2-C-methyl-D-erythritol kinase [Gemmatimonadaceae bacterium]
MSRTARVAAQGKVNLALRVLEREASGYHAIETLFARLELADAVVVRTGMRGRSIDCHGATWTEELPADQNLAYRAALAYASESGWPRGFAIEIEKRIPMGGGLGGGSADAGAVLRALDALASRALPPERMRDLAATLGADVPFLAGDAALALARGLGGELTPLEPLPSAHLRLIFPPFGIRTADAYRWIDDARGDGAPPPAARLTPADASDWMAVSRIAANDFEPVVIARHPDIGARLALLRDAGADFARMSGSGSTLFGLWHRAAPPASLDALTVATRTASRVVPVEIGE